MSGGACMPASDHPGFHAAVLFCFLLFFYLCIWEVKSKLCLSGVLTHNDTRPSVVLVDRCAPLSIVVSAQRDQQEGQSEGIVSCLLLRVLHQLVDARLLSHNSSLSRSVVLSYNSWGLELLVLSFHHPILSRLLVSCCPTHHSVVPLFVFYCSHVVPFYWCPVVLFYCHVLILLLSYCSLVVLLFSCPILLPCCSILLSRCQL